MNCSFVIVRGLFFLVRLSYIHYYRFVLFANKVIIDLFDELCWIFSIIVSLLTEAPIVRTFSIITILPCIKNQRLKLLANFSFIVLSFVML